MTIVETLITPIFFADSLYRWCLQWRVDPERTTRRAKRPFLLASTETDHMDSAESDGTLESHGSDIGQRTNSLTRMTEWLLVDGDRLYIATGISAGVFVFVLALNQLGVVAFVNDDSITRMGSGMIAGTFSLVTLVVSINQLILSREFSAASEYRDRVGGVMEFREDIEDVANVPASPAEPTKLLGLLVAAIDHRAQRVSDAVSDQDDGFREVVRKYTNSIDESTDRIDETLESTSFGTFRALSAAVGYDDAWQIYVARHLRNRNADSLSEAETDAFDDLIDALQLFNVAREHFKTTYLQRELTRFSQLTIYCGVPAVLAAVLVTLLYADLGGPAISAAYLPYVTSALVAIVFFPLALLSTYILRTATVTRRTASIGPMLPEKDPDAGPFEVSYDDEG